MKKFISYSKLSSRKLLRLILKRTNLHNSHFERVITGIIYGSPLLKLLFFDARSGTKENLPELRNILLTMDHDSLCFLKNNDGELSSRFNVPFGEETKYVEYINKLGYLPTHPGMESQPVNFRLRSIFDYKIDQALIKLERNSDGVVVTVHDRIFDGDALSHWMYRILAVTRNYSIGVEKIFDYYEAKGEEPFFYLDITDGGGEYESHLPIDSHVFSFCRKAESLRVGLIPDAYTLHDLEYNEQTVEWSSKEAALENYSKRDRKLFWRGSTTGLPPLDSLTRNRRIQFCLAANQYLDKFDCKITHVVQMRNNGKVYRKLALKNVTAPPVTESDFGKYSAYIDLDGNSAAWGTLRKYLLLVHIIRPQSDYQLFYHGTQPPDTYTSVMHERDIFAFAKSDPNYLHNFEVAWRGYNFALNLREKVMRGEATTFPE